MIVILDTNIIYSCFYKPEGVIATILKNRKNKLQFIAPSYLLDEIEEHLPQIMGKNQLTKRQAKTLLKEFTKNITFYKLATLPEKAIAKAKIKIVNSGIKAKLGDNCIVKNIEIIAIIGLGNII